MARRVSGKAIGGETDRPKDEPHTWDRSLVADPPLRVVILDDRGIEQSPRAECQSCVRPETTSGDLVVKPKAAGSGPVENSPRVTASRADPAPISIGRGKQILEMRAKGLLKS